MSFSNEKRKAERKQEMKPFHVLPFTFYIQNLFEPLKDKANNLNNPQ